MRAAIFGGSVMLGLAIVLMCQSGSDRPTQERRRSEGQRLWNEYPQTCETCDAKWLVTSLDGSPVPETTEWCFYCGFYCEKGIGLAVRSKDAKTLAELVEHCRECIDCRRAAFTPEQWKVENAKCP